MGAWIETRAWTMTKPSARVAPHVGAWIETAIRMNVPSLLQVAPHVGAWIETASNAAPPPPGTSLPTWERGLKQVEDLHAQICYKVAPHVGAWIETQELVLFQQDVKSLPTWERGLKLGSGDDHRQQGQSLPTWERGLKQKVEYRSNVEVLVAPHVGAWIETSSLISTDYPTTSLPTWERGLKLENESSCNGRPCRSPRGSVD